MTEGTTTERHPWGYRWHERFPNAARVEAFEGGAVYAAQTDGAWWLITDEGTLADFLDDHEDADLLAQLIRIERFDDRDAWEAAIAAVHARKQRSREDLG